LKEEEKEHDLCNQSAMVSGVEIFCFAAITNHFNLRQTRPCYESHDVVLRPDKRTGNTLFYERQLIPNLFASILCVDVKH
jgi:hypothetical protein